MIFKPNKQIQISLILVLILSLLELNKKQQHRRTYVFRNQTCKYNTKVSKYYVIVIKLD